VIDEDTRQSLVIRTLLACRSSLAIRLSKGALEIDRLVPGFGRRWRWGEPFSVHLSETESTIGPELNGSPVATEALFDVGGIMFKPRSLSKRYAAISVRQLSK